MNILKFEIRKNLKGNLMWGFYIVAFTIFYMMFYPMMGQDQTLFDELMSGFPQEFLDAFGFSAELPIGSILGYYALTYSFVLIVVGIHASILGFGLLSLEERELTADFLFTRPVKRQTIFLAKIGSMLVSVLIVYVITGLGFVLSILLFNGGNPYSLTNVFILQSALIFFQLIMVGLGMSISMLLKKIRNLLSLGIGLALSLYFIESIASMIHSDLLAFITPYSYFTADYILIEGTYDWPKFLLGIVIIAITFSSSYFLYIRRNIAAL